MRVSHGSPPVARRRMRSWRRRRSSRAATAGDRRACPNAPVRGAASGPCGRRAVCRSSPEAEPEAPAITAGAARGVCNPAHACCHRRAGQTCPRRAHGRVGRGALSGSCVLAATGDRIGVRAHSCGRRLPSPRGNAGCSRGARGPRRSGAAPPGSAKLWGGRAGLRIRQCRNPVAASPVSAGPSRHPGSRRSGSCCPEPPERSVAARSSPACRARVRCTAARRTRA